MPDHLARLKSDLSGRHAPVVDQVRAVIVGARAIVARGPYTQLLLLSALGEADPGDGLAVYYARQLLARVGGFPFLVNWLHEPQRTRGDVLRLLVRASKVFGVPHRGGWSVTPHSSLPASTVEASR